MKVGWAILSIGLILLAIAIKLGLNTRSFVAKSTSAKGKVLRLEEQCSSDEDDNLSYIFYPVIEFKSNNGKVV
jgi:hypothetical protein